MANAYTNKSINAWDDLQVPELQNLDLETLVQQGYITPEQAQAAQQDPSAMQAIATDPRLQQIQMDALDSLTDLSKTGMTAQDKAALNQIQTDESTKARGAREAILQEAQARGAGGSGLSMLAQLQNSQDAATRQSQRDMDVAGQAQARALQALQASGTQANQMQQTQFGQAAEKAKAQDAISQFNTANMQQTNLANTAANNAAQAANLGVKQNVADQNVATRNQEQVANKTTIPQQNYQNQLQKTTGQSGALSSAGKQQDANDQNTLNNIFKLGGTALTAGAMLSDQRAKEDISPFDASEFLDSLTGYKYKYKDKKNGDGEHVGPMAQDLEKTAVGSSMVEEGPEGKLVNTGKASMAALAGLADLHGRLKRLEMGEE